MHGPTSAPGSFLYTGSSGVISDVVNPTPIPEDVQGWSYLANGPGLAWVPLVSWLKGTEDQAAIAPCVIWRESRL